MDAQCIFCRIAAGEIPATRLLENETVVAFRDVNPQAPSHLLVVPRAHVSDLLALPAASDTWNALIEAVQEVVRLEGIREGFRVVINQGEHGGQTVAHLHLHVLAQRPLSWPPG